MLPGRAEGVDYPGGHAWPANAEGGGPGVFRGRRLRAGTGVVRRSGGQAWEPAVHSAQLMFQPLRPLSGVMVLSGEFWTMTTSPTIELS